MAYPGPSEERIRWPSEKRVWTISALLFAVALTGLAAYREYQQFTPLERWWFPAYLRMHLLLDVGRQFGDYRLLEAVGRNGKVTVVLDSEDVRPGETQVESGTIPFRLSEEGVRKGLVRLTLSPHGRYSNSQLKEYLTDGTYNDKRLRDLALKPAWWGLAALLVGLCVAIPKDVQRARIRRDGQRVKGPEMVTVREFNRRNRSDGMGFIAEEGTWLDKLLLRSRQVLRIPRERESEHCLMIGDSGGGKSSLMRQILIQVEQRQETAIVYDPAREYTRQFYDPGRGDLILNALDARMPYWNPSDEVKHPAEADTVAESLFPEEPGEKKFFVAGPRKIFAQLLLSKATPTEIIWCLSHEEEIKRLVKETLMEAVLHPGADQQRAGVLGSLNLVADALKLLPRKEETSSVWTATEWSRERRGWLFITSIKKHLEEEGLRGAGAAEIAAHRTRDEKLDVSHEEMQRRHRAMAEQYGNQPQQVVSEAQRRGRQHAEDKNEEQAKEAIKQALNYARERNLEREAVADERDLLRDALKRSMGEASLEQVRAEFNNIVEQGGLIEMEKEPGAPGRAFTTEEMIGLERENIQLMLEGQGQHPTLVRFEIRRAIDNEYKHLSNSQRAAVEEILRSRDQITALEGVAGAGKTSSLAAIRDATEREGYRVEGFAPTSGAAQKLEEAGISASTLQHHVARGKQGHGEAKHLYVLDESSLASTKQMNEFLHRLEEHDRVLLVGDVRQHEAVEAGKPYQQLQEAGMHVAHLDEIVRQKDPALKQAVQQLSRGEVRQAIGNLEGQGRVQEIEDRDERLKTMAETYCHEPQRTLVISPDNRSRQELNLLVHREMQERGYVREKEHTVTVLEARQEMTGADRAWAAQYQLGDTVRYSKGSKQLSIEAGRYATVRDVNRERNLVTVELENRKQVTYDPRRLRGVAVYREIERDFAQGERVQFTAPSKDLRVANRELGTIEKIQERGELTIRTDSGRQLQFNIEDHPHLEYGYALTSHSSQGQTADRVLVHADTELGEQLVNARMAYVAVSRGRYDVQIYTNDKSDLAHDLSRDIAKYTATGLDHEHEAAHKIARASIRHDAGHEQSAAPQGHTQGAGQGQAVGE